jgi:hypothetical protein
MTGWQRSILGAGLLSALTAASGCKSSEMAILDVNPRTGHTQGDQPVHIVGKNFRQDIGYTIYFGTKKTSSVTIRNPETIEVLTPPGVAPGKVDIMIRTDDGNAFRLPGAFSFLETGGKVGEGGATPGSKKNAKGNLAY